MSKEQTALEITGTDRPGLLSEISAVIAELECHVAAAVLWTHNTRLACIIYMEDGCKGGTVAGVNQVAHVQAQLENVLEAHHREGERRSVRITAPEAGRTHTERRLHQLMVSDGDYEECCSTSSGGERRRQDRYRDEIKVTIDYCKERGYSEVNVRCRDRPKLLFDTVCTLTDMQYVVFHAAISSKGSIAIQVCSYQILFLMTYVLLHWATFVLRKISCTLGLFEGTKNKSQRKIVYTPAKK